jgi:hypothetical protein
LFVGYSLKDWSFRVLFRAVIKEYEQNSRIPGITVQLSPTEVNDQAGATAYITKKYDKMGLKIFWGTASDSPRRFERKSTPISARVRQRTMGGPKPTQERIW